MGVTLTAMAYTIDQLLDLERRLSLAACAVNGLLHPPREHPRGREHQDSLERIARQRLAELRAALGDPAPE